MNIQDKPVLRWFLLLGCLGMIIAVTACAGLGIGANSDETLRLKDRVVEIRNEGGEWIPVAGGSTFELVGELESADPWIVAGRTLETNEVTQIEENLQVGNIVRAKGAILEGDTWVAYSIGLAEDQSDSSIILIGIVDSVDPWVVNGITLNVTDNTIITGEITAGMIVRVDILLLADGTWEVVSIAPLGDSTETPGCVTVIATVLSVDGDQIQFLGWHATVTLGGDTQAENDEENNSNEEESDQGEDEDESGDEDNGNKENEEGERETIHPGDVVRAVVCVSEDGQIVIVQITILNTDESGGDTPGNGEKVLVCHNVSKNPHTINISVNALPAHLAHGDTLGPCP